MDDLNYIWQNLSSVQRSNKLGYILRKEIHEEINLLELPEIDKKYLHQLATDW